MNGIYQNLRTYLDNSFGYRSCCWVWGLHSMSFSNQCDTFFFRISSLMQKEMLMSWWSSKNVELDWDLVFAEAIWELQHQNFEKCHILSPLFDITVLLENKSILKVHFLMWLLINNVTMCFKIWMSMSLFDVRFPHHSRTSSKVETYCFFEASSCFLHKGSLISLFNFNLLSAPQIICNEYYYGLLCSIKLQF